MSFLWIRWTGITAPGTSACPENKVARVALTVDWIQMPTLIQNASTGRRFAAWVRSPGPFPSPLLGGRAAKRSLENGTFGFVCRVYDSSLANNSAALAADLKKPAVVVVYKGESW